MLKVAEVLDSGKSLLRGTLLFELQASSVALAKTLLSSEEITQEECGVSIDLNYLLNMYIFHYFLEIWIIIILKN